MKIDSHQHFWNPARDDYGWLTPAKGPLFRPYGPADLTPWLQGSGVEATVLVQAAPTVNETEYMLGIADSAPFVAGLVGWIDFENPADLAHLHRLRNHPKFKGVRPMIQDIPDDNWMHRDDVQWGYKALCDLDLTFDALGFPRHVDGFLALVKRYPAMRVVLDHFLKPQIHAHNPADFRLWADGMSRLADTGAYVKFSALITEARPDWTEADLKPYADHIFAAFGPERVMWGSDWPVCRLRSEYDRWHQAAVALTAHLPPAARADIFGGTAKRFYRL